MAGPLENVRVLDLTTMVAGPVATMMLADQGAEVIKIESPRGDLMRNFGSINNGMAATFLSCNRNKRGLALDIKTPDGIAILKKLVATADVFVQNFRPGAIARMGLGEDVVRAIRPDVIYVSISGFGESGPYAHQRVYDPVIQALCGLADIQTDYATGQPRMVRTIVPDKTTAVTAAQAITAALFARERTGEGQHIRIAMLDTMIAYLWPEGISSLSFVGKELDPARGQMGLDLIFRTEDGYITAGALSDAEWSGMCAALDRADLLEDERFRTAASRAVHGAERREIVSAEIRKWPTREVLDRLDREEVPCAPVLTRWQLLDDEQVKANEVIEIHRDTMLGEVRQPRPAARFDRTPAEIRALAPYLGGDNAAILEEIGYSETEIARLGESGVLAGRGPDRT
ncbi:MAG: CoA transferase [Rhodospirillaceae bacterium]|nr:CoA transferase [Rhodospirillaceae bacterium]MYH37250.1 CoA transferase [Rhodospirillaceae bacterium]MYK14911.1 CoA transferase [Rhodospirillaceae bacterium]MYK57971.1 CoA transferase [Rhodospirillaceae bacterium]